MLRKVAIASISLALVAYLLFSGVFLSGKSTFGERVCKVVQVELLSKSNNPYLSEKDIIAFLDEGQLNPIGRTRDEIQTDNIEKMLRAKVLIQEVEVYKTMDGAVKIDVELRTPILRVITENKNYYVDDTGGIMPVPANFAVLVPVATGNVKEAYAKSELYKFVVSLQADNFWNDQIEQIHVLPNLDVELIAKEGNHTILLGKIEDSKENLEKLQLFYEQGLKRMGWNRYSTINLKYRNQIVCTKKRI
ncbi:cell division protein FtsQ [Bacteroidia bacterium]|nr:cell division protein FtsQ [Bacteroidia bacterium]